MKKYKSKKTIIIAIILLVFILPVILMTYSTLTSMNDNVKDTNISQSYEPLKYENIIVPDKKLRVDYFFWLKCAGCYAIEPVIADWYLNISDDIDFNFVPVGWSGASKDAEAFYIVKKIYEDGRINKQKFVTSVQDLFDITFVDKKPLNHKNIYSKIVKHKAFKSEEDFNSFISENNDYIKNGIRYSEEISRMLSVESVPSIVLDKTKSTSTKDYNNDSIKMIENINRLAKEKSSK